MKQILNYLTSEEIYGCSILIKKKEFEKFKKVIMGGVYEIIILLIMDKIGRPTYGYEISKHLDEISNGKFHLTEGTLYPILKKLEKSGLVKSFWGESEVGPPRKYYTLTTKGRKFLEKALNFWEDIESLIDKLRGEE